MPPGKSVGIGRPIGIVLLAVFIIYMFVTARQALRAPDSMENEADGEGTVSTPKVSGLLALGALLIAVGAKLLVDNGILIATALGVPESVIALTFVALGTSLPELVLDD